MALRDLIFWIVAIVTVGCALSVVFNRNIFRAALFLIVTFFSIAILYVLLAADFLAAVQVLIYVGAIGVLIIFAVMLTRKMTGGPILMGTHGVLRGGAMAGLFLLLSVGAILRQDLSASVPGDVVSPAALGRGFLVVYMLPFEVLSILLVAAMIGSVVLARKDDA